MHLATVLMWVPVCTLPPPPSLRCGLPLLGTRVLVTCLRGRDVWSGTYIGMGCGLHLHQFTSCDGLGVQNRVGGDTSVTYREVMQFF